jgi:hypothetical protein
MSNQRLEWPSQGSTTLPKESLCLRRHTGPDYSDLTGRSVAASRLEHGLRQAIAHIEEKARAAEE